MQIMTLKQWHSNDRQSKINTRTWVKIKKNWQSGKHTATRFTTYYYIYLNRKRLRIIKDLPLKLLQTGSCKLWSLERSPYGLLLTGGSGECRQWAGENSTLKVSYPCHPQWNQYRNIHWHNGTYTFYEEKHWSSLSWSVLKSRPRHAEHIES